MRRGLQTFYSSGWVRGLGRAGEREQEERAPGRLVEPARRVAAGSQALVGTAAASRQVRAVLTPLPLTLSRSLLLSRDVRGLSPAIFPACIRLQPGGALPHAGAPGARRTPSPLCPLSPLCPAATASPPPPPSPAPALREATQPRPALAARGHAQQWAPEHT